MTRLALLPFPLYLFACGSGTIVLKGEFDSGDSGLDESGPQPDTDSGEETGGEDTGGEETGGEETGGEDTGEEEEIDADIIVDCTGRADYTKIQDAIDASVSGDVIAVKPCVYHERLDLLGKTITVYGIAGSAETIVDGDEGGTVLDAENGEGVGTRFAGFTLRGGYDIDAGAAIEVYLANLELEDIVITGNAESMYMIQSFYGWLDMKDVRIQDNVIDDDGAAVWADGGSLTIDGLEADCDGGAAAIWAHLVLLMDRSTLNCDTGHGIDNYHGELWIARSTITAGLYGLYTYDEAGTPEDPDNPTEQMYVYNSAIGGGSVGVEAMYQDVRIVNSVLWGEDAALRMTACNTASYARNTVFTGADCGISGDQSFDEAYNAFWDNEEDACGLTVRPQVDEDPLFEDFPTDLEPRSGSPLVDAGDPSAEYDDTDGTRNDIGVFGGPWGSWD